MDALRQSQIRSCSLPPEPLVWARGAMTERCRKLLVQFEVPLALVPLLAIAAVVIVPPAVAGMAGWWSVRLRRGRVRLRAVWARLVAALREAVLHWLNGGGR